MLYINHFCVLFKDWIPPFLQGFESLRGFITIYTNNINVVLQYKEE